MIEEIKKTFLESFNEPTDIFENKDDTKIDYSFLDSVLTVYMAWLEIKRTEEEDAFSRLNGLSYPALSFYAGYIAGMKHKEGE